MYVYIHHMQQNKVFAMEEPWVVEILMVYPIAVYPIAVHPDWTSAHHLTISAQVTPGFS